MRLLERWIFNYFGFANTFDRWRCEGYSDYTNRALVNSLRLHVEVEASSSSLPCFAPLLNVPLQQLNYVQHTHTQYQGVWSNEIERTPVATDTGTSTHISILNRDCWPKLASLLTSLVAKHFSLNKSRLLTYHMINWPCCLRHWWQKTSHWQG